MIPEDLQWLLLSESVGEDVSGIIKERTKLARFDAVGMAGDSRLHVMGAKNVGVAFDTVGDDLYDEVSDHFTGERLNVDVFREPGYIFESPLVCALSTVPGLGIPFLIRNLMPSVRKRGEKTRNYWELKREILESHIQALSDLADPVKVYQGSIGEVSNDLDRPLERVDTGNPETFIRRDDRGPDALLFLKAHTALLGGDAVVHYQPGSAIGTPVRYKDAD